MCNVYSTSQAKINSKSLSSMEKYPLNGFTGKSLRREFGLQKRELTLKKGKCEGFC